MRGIILIVTLFLAMFAVVWVANPAHAQTGTSTVTFNLTWTDNANNEEGFIVYQDNVEVKRLPVNSITTSVVVTGTWGQVVCYHVSAFNHSNVDGTGDFQESAKSNQACATISVPTQPAPTTPSDLIIGLQQALKAILEFKVAQQ